MKLVWLIKMCLRGASRDYSRIHAGKHFPNTYAIKNGLKQ